MTTVVYPRHERSVHVKIKKYRETSTSHDTSLQRNLLPSLFSIRCLSQRTSCRSFTRSTESSVPEDFGCGCCSTPTSHFAAVRFFVAIVIALRVTWKRNQCLVHIKLIGSVIAPYTEWYNIRVIIGTVHFFHMSTYKIPSS